MCAGCVQSGLEFAATGSVALAAGLRHARLLARERLRPEEAASRRMRHESEVAAFLERLDLDPVAILGREAAPGAVPADPPAEELQPA